MRTADGIPSQQRRVSHTFHGGMLRLRSTDPSLIEYGALPRNGQAYGRISAPRQCCSHNMTSQPTASPSAAMNLNLLPFVPYMGYESEYSVSSPVDTFWLSAQYRSRRYAAYLEVGPVDRMRASKWRGNDLYIICSNFEDVMLWRVFNGIDSGFYIDVGAHDPSVDSVTLAFYERGWRGINIEPVNTCHERVAAHRPRDINLNVALGENSVNCRFMRCSVRACLRCPLQ